MDQQTTLPEQPSVLQDMITANQGESLLHISQNQPVLLVFLRHFGCSFCREAMADIARKRARIEADGIRIVMVHMASEPEIAEKYFKKYKLWPIDHIVDPTKHFYRSFGLLRGTPAQLFGLMNWVRGFQAGIIEGHGFAYHSEDIGDGFQMPGVFVVHKGEIKNSFVHNFAYDRPDYEEIVACCAY